MKVMKDVNVHLENKKVSRAFFAYLFIMYSVVYMTKSCFSGALSAIVAEGSLTLSQTTSISAAFYIAYAPLQVLGGIFADKYSPERLIIIGLLGGAAANTVIFFNQSYYVMLFAWIFNAIIQFALWPSVFKIISSLLVRSDRKSMAFLISLGSSGGLVLSFAVAACIPSHAWKYNFAVSAVSLILSAIVMRLFCARLDPILKKDKIPAPEPTEKNNDKTPPTVSTSRLFLMSGFFAVLPAVLLRIMLETGVRNFSSTMLMQSYNEISPSVGNLLSVLVVVGGILGVVIAKFVIFPRIIKNEITACLVTTALSIPFAVVLSFIGPKMPVLAIVISMTLINLLLTASTLFIQYYNMYFTKYGKNGTAAGIINAAAAAGMALQFCIFGPVAERLGWPTVTAIWIGMIAVTVLCLAIALRPANKFKKENT